MAIFGTIDAKALANNVSVTNNSTTVTTTGDFTDRNTNNFIQSGDILSLSGVQYTVESVVSATTLKLTTAYAASTGTVTAANAIRRTAPKEVANLLINENGLGDKFPSGTQLLFIDNTEATLEENRIRGLKWSGWWTYRTYTDGDGNTRHKTECIAFAKQTAANAGDFDSDNPAADVASAITISGQPSAQSTSGPAGAILTFTRAGTAAAGTGSYTITGATAGNVVTNVSGGAAPAANGYEFTVARAAGVYTVTVVTGGSGFASTDTILVKGSQLGGVDSTNDLTITVSTVAAATATFSVTAAVGTGTLTYQWQVQTAASTTKWSNIVSATSASLVLTGLVAGDSGKKYRVKIGGSAGGEEVISNTATLTVTAA
jgi:hypothetical protein